jgi:hypothetical protein
MNAVAVFYGADRNPYFLINPPLENPLGKITDVFLQPAGYY